MKINRDIKIKKSNIHGLGIFAQNKINKNKTIGVGIEYKFFTIPIITKNFGSLINHSYKPNTRLYYKNSKYYIVANKNINKGDEITLNYNNTPWFIANAEKHYI